MLHSGIAVYPNPVTDKKVNLEIKNLVKGNYSVLVTTTAGQQVMATTIQHNKENETFTMDLPSTITAGGYQLRVTGRDGTVHTLKLIVE